MDRLFDPPPVFELPLSLGADIYFGIVYKPLVVDVDGEPVLDGQGNRQYVEADYPDGATVRVEIDAATPVVIDTTIDGSLATVWGDFKAADTVKKGALWRAVITYVDDRDKVLCNGKVARYDGQVTP